MAYDESMPPTTSVTREDVLLLIAEGAAGPYPLDPIRTMKGCFLAAERGDQSWGELFSFEPYDYGPFDSGVYRACEALVARGLLAVDHAGRYETYSLTPEGREAAALSASSVGEPAATWLRRLGAYVTSKSFSQLLKEIYAAFPAFAQRSVVLGRMTTQ
jgi:uncharacterized protein